MRGYGTVLGFALGLAIGLHPMQAFAVPVTVLFSGRVGSVIDFYGDLDGSIGSGTPFHGSYRYQLGVPDLDPSTIRARYEHRAWKAELTVGNYSFASAPGTGLRITVEDAPLNFSIGDEYRVATLDVGFSIWLFDSTSLALPGTDLVAVAPDLSRFGLRHLTFAIAGPSGSIGSPSVSGTIESMTLLVTEFVSPLFALAAAGLGALWRHGLGRPGGREAGSKPPACSMRDWGTVQ